jgi:ABC-type transport system involved in cytochrome c biogenesis permease component
MIYSLGITITAGILILAFFIAVSVLARRVAYGEGLGTLRGWRWYPSPLALFVLIPILAVLLVRAAPLLFALPLVIPIIWRTRWLAGPLLYIWNLGRRTDQNIGPPF